MSRFFKDIFSVSATNSVNTLLRFVAGIVLARALGPEGKGIYSSLMVVPAMVVTFAELGIRRSTIQHIGAKEYPLEKILSVLSFFFVFTSFTGIGISAFIYFTGEFEGFNSLLIILALLTIPVNLLNKYNNGIFIGNQQYKTSNLLRSIPVILNLVFLLLFLFLMKLWVEGALFATLIANLVSSISGLLIILKRYKISIRYNPEIIKSLLGLGLVYAGALFLVRLNFRIDILILKYLSSNEQVGYYSLGASVAEGWQSPFALGAVILSSSANSSNQSQVNKDVARLFRFVTLISLFIATVIYFISPFLIVKLYGKEFLPSVGVVQRILPAVLIVVIAKVLAQRLAGLKKTYLVYYIYLPALIINVILNFILIPQYQALGAVYSSVASYFFSFLLLLIFYCKHTHTPLLELVLFRKVDFQFLSNYKRFKSKRKTIDKTL